jgi:glutamyl-tRNA synthetase
VNISYTPCSSNPVDDDHHMFETPCLLQVEEEDDFQQLVNEHSKTETAALGDINMAQLPKGTVLQLERKGYYIVDDPYGGSPDKPAVLLNIPDGRSK